MGSELSGGQEALLENRDDFRGAVCREKGFGTSVTPVSPTSSASPGSNWLCGLIELGSGHALPLCIAYPGPRDLWWGCVTKLRLIQGLGSGGLFSLRSLNHTSPRCKLSQLQSVHQFRCACWVLGCLCTHNCSHRHELARAASSCLSAV